MSLTQALENDIKILKTDLKDENQLKEILKKRLTKKEFKLYNMRIDNIPQKDICEQLKIDTQRYEQILNTVLKKLNYEKLKSELSLKD